MSNSNDITTSGPSGGMAPPAAFQTASALPRPSLPSVPSNGSMRNASGGLPPIPKDPPAAAETSNGDGAEGASGSSSDAAAKPVKPINRPAASKNAIVYSAVQRRNPVLQAIKNVGIEIGDIVADYQVGTHNGVLFLSLKYHRLHPEYIHQRIEKMKNHYHFRVILILCDVNEHQQSLRELTKIAIVNDFTVFVAWSNEEIAQYLTTLKAFEHKGDESLRERVHQSYHEQLQHVLISGKKVNKTDAENLAAQFGSFASIARQPAKVLAGVKGLGATKVNSLVDAFTKPFVVGGLKRPGSSSSSAQATAGSAASALALNGNGNGGVVADRKGKRKAGGSGADGDEEDEEGHAVGEEDAGSPDWPSSPEGDGDDGGERAERQRERVPSRSPGVSPEPAVLGDVPGAGGTDAVWRDPLDDEPDEDQPDDGGAEAVEDDGSARKRARLDE